ncbi:dehydrase and lipid transport-domain-containing protein [Scleroderma yunnanense]
MLQPLQRRVLNIATRGSLHHRGLFSLPNIPFPGNDGSDTQTYHERKILPYRQSDLYRIVADVESYPNFLPYCTGSRVFNRNERKDGVTLMDAEITVGFLALQESCVCTVTCKPYESVQAVAASSSTLLKTLNTVWRFQSASPNPQHLPKNPPLDGSREKNIVSSSGDGPTIVTLDLEFAFANPVHAAVSAQFFGQVSQLMVKAFEEHCRAVHGHRLDDTTLSGHVRKAA